MTYYNDRFNELYAGKWTNYGCYYFNSSLFRVAFTGSKSKCLPINTEDWFASVVSDDGETMALLKLIPPHPKGSGSGKARVFVQCENCSKWIPGGRISQHKC